MKKLGYLLLYRVPSRIYARDEITNVFGSKRYLSLVDKCAKTGEPVIPYLPAAPHEADVFRKACAIVGKEFRVVKDKYQRTVKIRLTDVHSDSEYIQKDVVQEVVKARTVSANLHQNTITESIAKITFRHKAPNVEDKLKIYLTVDLPDAIDREYWAPGISYLDLFSRLNESLGELRGAISDVQFRAWANDYVKYRLGGRTFSPVRGTIFLPGSDKAVLFVEALGQIEGVFAQAVPIYDDGTTLRDLAEQQTASMEEEIRSLLDEIDIKKGMRSDKVSRVARELAYYGETASEYAGMGLMDDTKIAALLAKASLQLQMAMKAGEVEKEKRAAERAYRKERERGLAKVERSSGLFGEAV